MSQTHAWIVGATAACSAVVHANPVDTVYVTAPRRIAAIEEVAMSVTVLSDTELDSEGIDSIDTLATRIPTLDSQRSVGIATTTLRIRRIGTLGNVPTLEPAVGLFVDGAYRQRSFLASDLLDIGRVEILAGPQSTLYGRNVSAGVLALHTREPPLQVSAWGDITVGRIDVENSPSLFDASAGVGGPISESLRAGIATGYSSHGHTMANTLSGMPDGNEKSQWTWKGQALWSSNSLTARLIAGYVHQYDDQGESDVHLAPGSRTAASAELLAQRGLAYRCPDNTPNNRRTCSIATNELQFDSFDITLNVEAALANGWTLASTSAWDRFEALRIEDDAVQLYAPILYFHDAQEGSALQQELRLLSPDNARVTWLAGVFVLRSDFERGAHGSVPVFGPNGALAFDSIWPTPFALPDQHGVHDSRTIATYWSAFAEATLPITARLELNIGARWHDEHKRARIENSVAVPGASIVASVLTPSVGAMNAPINGQVERRSEAFTWSITPKYHVSEHLMTYATAARNTKAGGFNNGTGSAPLSPREFGDETIHHFELGFRQVVSQRQLTVSGAAFRTRYENYQDATFLLAQFAVGNVERVDLTGAELSGKTQLGERTTLDAAVSYVDLEYVRHTAGMCYPGRPPDGRLAGSCDLSGERPLAAPPWQTQLGLQHTVPTSWGTVFGRVDWSWSDRYFTTFSLDPRLVQQNAHEVGLRLGTRIDDAYEIILWGRNLLGEDIVEIASTLNFFNDTSWQSFMGEPRSYGVTLRARF